jgi:hypothetical protein
MTYGEEEIGHEEVGKTKEELVKIGYYAVVAEVDTVVEHPKSERSEKSPKKPVL